MWNTAEVDMLRAGNPKRPCSQSPVPAALFRGFILRKVGLRNPCRPLSPRGCLRITQGHPIVVSESTESSELEAQTESPSLLTSWVTLSQ